MDAPSRRCCVDVALAGGNDTGCVLKGRILRVDSRSACFRLADDSGALTLSCGEGLVPQVGDIVSAVVRGDPPEVTELHVLTPYRRSDPFPSPGADYYRLNQGTPSRIDRLRLRARVVKSIRDFFDQRDYVEVHTPLRVAHPGLDPQIGAQPAGQGYLITSPEYQMKRLLAAGMERIYFLGSCWRGDEAGPRHLGEFSMLEWYQAHAGMDELMDLTEELVRHVIESATAGGDGLNPDKAIDVSQPFARVTMADAFARFGVGVDIRGILDAGELRSRAQRAAFGPFAEDASFEEIFTRIFVERVEPRLAELGPVFLTEYPAPLAALARLHPERPCVAERAELIVDGIELSNGYAELIDPQQQRARLEADQQARSLRGMPVYPIDERFIEALREGIPPAAGNAMGVDRLVMLIAGADHIRDVVAFSPDEI